MTKFQTLFKTFDDAIFQQMDALKNSEAANKFNQFLQQFTPEIQKVINQSLNILFFLVPILIVVSMSFNNFRKRHEINTKIEIFELINQYTQKKMEVDAQSQLVVSPKTFAKQTDLEDQLKQTYNSNGIDINKMSIISFKQDSKIQPLLKTEAGIKFKNLTMSNLGGFLLALLRDYKMKITAIDIKLEKDDNSLSGNLNVIHYAKIKK